MSRLLAALACLLVPVAGIAATPAVPAPGASASTQAQITALQHEMQDLARKMAALSARDDDGADARALRYLTSSNMGTLGMVVQVQAGAAKVDAVTPDGPAERAGIRVGDLITAVGATSLKSNGPSGAFTLTPLLNLKAGMPVTLTIARDGKTLHVTATPTRMVNESPEDLARTLANVTKQAATAISSPAVQKQLAEIDSPAFREQLAEALKQAQTSFPNGHVLALDIDGDDATLPGAPWWGLNLAPLNPDLGRYFGTDTGALVLSRDAGRYPELQPGDVITRIDGHAISGPDSAMRAFRAAPPAKRIRVEVRRHDKHVRLDFKVPARSAVLPPLPPASAASV